MQPPAGSQVSRVPAQRTPPEQLAPPAPAPAPVRPKRSLRTVVGVVAGVLALLCTGGAVAGFVLYDRATAPDRSAPDVVVDNYLRAFLVDRNDTKADEFACKSDGDLDAVRGLRAEVEQREANFDVVVRVSWGPLTRVENGDGESVTTTLAISSSADGQTRSSRREDWQFQVVERDGWRVCGASKVG
ncbi:Rv0361 family membrane protein [Micromonospora chalcea]|uniref:Rv0361 family membrane protein n=1 Tax=Micromonospora chalcea TaxID=1874 RepID=UPI00378A74DB